MKEKKKETYEDFVEYNDIPLIYFITTKGYI